MRDLARKVGVEMLDLMERNADSELQIAKQVIDFIPSEEFELEPDQVAVEVEELLAQLASKKTHSGQDAYMYSHGMGDLPVLSRDEEVRCFKAMNYLKHEIKQLQRTLKTARRTKKIIDQILEMNDQVRTIRDHLIYSNLRLVISLVKKFVSPQFSFDELYSEGIVTLMQAVEKFDYQRGFRFSTYAYRSISRALYQCTVKQQQQNTLFVEDSDQWVADAVEQDYNQSLKDQLWRHMRDRLSELVERLDRREQLIVRARYALSPSGKIKTFQTLANKLGISKERVRQLEQRAVAKLQAMASELEMVG
jgi:RNA polymerase primary sigma factor